jgi:hypothetical protein
LATSYEVAGLTTGQAYQFRYLVRNEVGSSVARSPILTTYAAVLPGQMTAPSTEINSLDALISWAAKDAGGLPITGYRVYIKSQAGIFTLESTYCLVSEAQCSVPLLVLQQSPFNLVQGTLVQARVAAVNLIGESLQSS